MKKIRLITLLLAALMLLSACSQPGEENITEQSTEAETLPPVPFDFSVSDLTIVRPEKAVDELKNAFISVREALAEKWKIETSPADDWINPTNPLPESEILIGRVNREETEQVYSELANGEFTIRVVGKKLVILGKTDDLTITACQYFIDNVLAGSSADITSAFCYNGRGNFDVEDIRIGDTSISEFVIVTPTNVGYTDIANTLSATLEKLCGAAVPVVSARSEKAAHEIVIGPAGRDASAPAYGYDDTEVYLKDGSLYIGSSNVWTATVGVNYLISRVSTGEKNINLAPQQDGRTLYSFFSGTREEYIQDPTKLQMRWAFTWEPSEDLIKYENKIACLNATDKNHIFTVSHRADWLFYPENCVESIISVWAMGGDCVEIDVHFTRDGIAVLMHDDKLTRMTDFSDKAGKNGLPSSQLISDWSYAELQQLNLKQGAGGSGAAVTPYKIPTLEEVLTLCKGRLFVILDKPLYWRYIDLPGYQTTSQANFIYPIMEKTGNFESVLISYSDTTNAYTLTPAQAVNIQKKVYEQSGQKMFMYLRAWNSRGNVIQTASYFEKNSLTNSGILVDGAYNNANYYKIKEATERFPNSFFGSWTIADDTDNEKCWNEMYSIGLRSIMSNNMFGLVQYAQTKIEK